MTFFCVSKIISFLNFIEVKTMICETKNNFFSKDDNFFMELINSIPIFTTATNLLFLDS